MAHERSSRLSNVLEGISLLNAVETEWVRGAKNPLIKEVLDRKKRELYEELFILLTQNKGRKPVKSKKLASQADIARP